MDPAPTPDIDTSVSAAESHSMDAFLADVVKCWTEHTKAMLLINDIFMYMHTFSASCCTLMMGGAFVDGLNICL